MYNIGDVVEIISIGMFGKILEINTKQVFDSNQNIFEVNTLKIETTTSNILNTSEFNVKLINDKYLEHRIKLIIAGNNE